MVQLQPSVSHASNSRKAHLIFFVAWRFDNQINDKTAELRGSGALFLSFKGFPMSLNRLPCAVHCAAVHTAMRLRCALGL